MPQYEFVFPDGRRAETSVDDEIKPYDVVRCGSALFRIGRLDPPDVVAHRGERVSVELKPLAADAPVVGVLHEITSQ